MAYRTRPGLTPARARVLAAIVRLRGELARFPSMREVAKALGYTHPANVADTMHRLRREGYLLAGVLTHKGKHRIYVEWVVTPDGERANEQGAR